MTRNEPAKNGSPDDLPDALHGLKNCLSVIRSGCLLMEDALGRGATAEVQPLIDAMRNSTGEALTLIRSIPELAADARRDEGDS